MNNFLLFLLSFQFIIFNTLYTYSFLLYIFYMIAKVKTLINIGIEAKEVIVEVDIRNGLPKFDIVGLASKSVQEAKERVTSAIRNSEYIFPSKHIIVNLSPADIPKSGPSFDLPIAIGVLQATGQLFGNINNYYFMGELSLEGEVKHIHGVLPLADYVYKLNKSIDSVNERISIVVSNSDEKEAKLVPNTDTYAIKNLSDIVDHINNHKIHQKSCELDNLDLIELIEYQNDFAHIKGQRHTKRALEIAAAGSHNLLLNGTPGSGKSMLAKAFPSILPDITLDEGLEITRIYSVAGLLDKDNPLMKIRPFRKPHHTCSDISLVGGGSLLKPGEISLAHRGVLFLDEFPEFSTQSIESLRQPLEDRIVTISRATGSLTYPANFMLIAAMNPCKCGWKGDKEKVCTCTSIEVQRYQKKISGPILDRIDIQVWVPRVEFDKLIIKTDEEKSIDIKKRIQKARNIQLARYKTDKLNIIANSELPQKDIEKYININESSMKLLKSAVERMNLSARTYFRILKVARTIADLSNSEHVETEHIAESLSYRIQEND